MPKEKPAQQKKPAPLTPRQRKIRGVVLEIIDKGLIDHEQGELLACMIDHMGSKAKVQSKSNDLRTCGSYCAYCKCSC